MVPTPNLTPHPLVTALGARLGAPGSALAQAGSAFDSAAVPTGTVTTPTGAKRGTPQATALADALAQDPHVSELVTFAGYLGGVAEGLTGPPATAWRLFYFDSKLRTWLLVEEGDILLRDIVKDDQSPLGERDVIWLKIDAPVSEGSGTPQPSEAQARMLRGEFISAGDFRTDSTTGTLAASTGVFCDARSVGCCKRGTW